MRYLILIGAASATSRNLYQPLGSISSFSFIAWQSILPKQMYIRFYAKYKKKKENKKIPPSLLTLEDLNSLHQQLQKKQLFNSRWCFNLGRINVFSLVSLIRATLARRRLLNCGPCPLSHIQSRHKWLEMTLKGIPIRLIGAKWEGSSAADVWLATVVVQVRLASHGPIDVRRYGWGSRARGGGGLSHMAWDQYPAVCFTSVKTLTHSSVEHLIWLQICRIFVLHFQRELKHLTFADTLPEHFWSWARDIRPSCIAVSPTAKARVHRGRSDRLNICIFIFFIFF